MPLDILLETSNWLMKDSPNKSYVRLVKRIWMAAVVAISIGVVAVSVVGGLIGYLDVPGGTKNVFLAGLLLVVAVTVLAGVVAPIVYLLQKLGSTFGRATGNANVHSD